MLVAACVLLLTGCGGGSDEVAPVGGTDPNAAAPVDPNAAPPTDPNAAPVDPAATGTDPSALTVGDPSTTSDSGSSTAAPGGQIGTSEATPKEFTNALGEFPIVVVIYQPKSDLDELVLDEAVAAAKSVKDTRLFAIKAGDFKYFADIPEKVGMFGSPAVAVIDRKGTLENVWKGYVDTALIRRSLLIAEAAAKPAVKPSDAPPATSFDEAAKDAATADA